MAAGFEPVARIDKPAAGDLWPVNAPEQVKLAAIFAGLKAVADRLAGTVYARDGAPVGWPSARDGAWRRPRGTRST
jgi:hypothetical protein